MSSKRTALGHGPPQADGLAPAEALSEYAEPGDDGFRQTLSNLQIQMIAIGGAVGVGLFLGLGERLRTAGPGLVFSYLVVSVVVYLLMRALGELVVYRPTTGAFVSYAREFVGPRFAHLTGWIYVTLGSLAAVAETAAVAVYAGYWFPDLPGWVPSVLALCLIAGSNLLTARAFGFIEVAASSVKIAAIVLFLAAGVLVIAFGDAAGVRNEASVTHLWADGGLFPNGVWPAVIVMQAVVFSYSAIEIAGISAGEAKDPGGAMPKAIRSVVLRIGVFYLGSIVVLSMLLPTRRYSGAESPFVTALGSLGIPYLGGIMNFVVLTAAISGVNATLYASVRMLRNLAANGTAPRAAARMTKNGVPVGALLGIGTFCLAGLLLIFFAGAGNAFEITLHACAVCILFGWVAIFVSHLGFRREVAAGRIAPVAFRMPGAPWTDWLCLAALAAVFAAMVFDFSQPTWYYSLFAAVALLVVHNLTYEIATRRRTPHDSADGAPAEPR
ncbi:amino acid permease [Streptomyces cavernicola]|uniref:Amino acid permease n=1 Tax=Streptomyces cavernicola TaxID=3043613 RepID=A0ABT6S5L0_9ACTN|nr:amino acid permease [Streptomyces sp. B-S-A6]MDI3403194.1 amino acid permease [Streptomyces sp. B-S-A6]